MQGQRTDTPARATSGRVTVTCDEVLDLSAAESMRAQLLAAVARGGDLEIQAAAVRQIDTANLVDELQGQQQVVIKSLETNCGRIEGLAGATILGDGSVAFILDMVGLVRLARQGTRAARDVGGSGDAIDSDASGGGRTARATRDASHAAPS